MDFRSTLLDQSPLFRSVDLHAIRDELQAASVIELPAGKILLDPAHVNEEIYILLAGQLIVCLEPNPASPLATIQIGECLGELSIIDDRPPSAYVVAATDARLLCIPRLLLWEMQDKQKVISFNLLRILAERIRGRNESLLNSLQLQRQYRNKAETDVLTGLKNRAWMEEVFPRQLELSERLEQPYSLVMVDIDHFKKVNDTHGHAVGDIALRHIGGLIRQHSRATDLPARYGGEEIAILMTATDAEQATKLCERLRQVIADTPIPFGDQQTLRATVSIGVANGFSGASLGALFERADQALYQAKMSGRNKVVSNILSNPLGT